MTNDLKIVVGLGNPGRKYEGTRHNVGFAVVDTLATGSRCGRFHHRFQAQLAEWVDDPHRILLVKPETFMNLSGRCVRELIDFYQLPLRDLLIVCDDFNLPLGKLRARVRGTHGGHNGLRDIQSHLGTTEYSRLRIGVENPGDKEAIEHVLGRFRPAEKPVIQEAIARAAQAVCVWIHQGMDACMNQYNG